MFIEALLKRLIAIMATLFECSESMDAWTAFGILFGSRHLHLASKRRFALKPLIKHLEISHRKGKVDDIFSVRHFIGIRSVTITSL